MYHRQLGTALLAAIVGLSGSHNRAQPISKYIPHAIGLHDANQMPLAERLVWTAPVKGSLNTLGSVSLTAANGRYTGLVRVMIKAQAGNLVCQGTSWNSEKTQLTINLANGTAVTHVTVVPQSQDNAGLVSQAIGPAGLDSNKHVERASLAATIDADQTGITSLSAIQVESSNRKAIAIPYYDQPISYLASLTQYTNTWWDWHATSASAIRGGTAQYFSKTDGTFNRVHEQLEVAISSDLDAVLPMPGRTPSPYRSVLSGRTVLDIWDKGFRPVQQDLADLGDFGLEKCVAIIHNWQAAGYDNALPEHFPADPRLGGNGGLQAAIAQGKKDGCLVALHENYVDYYPNYPNFDDRAIALNSDGSRMTSYLNKSTGIQSFATKPGWMVSNAKTQSPALHQTLGTTADFLDVNSAVWPSWHGDMDAKAPSAAMLTAFLHDNASLWAYERSVHNGPVFGEGNEHWYYSGLLDGVEAQLGAGATPMNTGESLPLFVDFDLLTIHPLQVNHGMGYYSRWTRPGTTMSTLQLDAYRMQEIAFGHAPFLGQGTWNDISKALIEINLVGPVAARYATYAADSIKYYVNGEWVSSSVAAPAGHFETVQVNYHNGLKIVANSSPTALKWTRLNLPQYGWAAEGPDLLAYTAQCGDTICDYAQTGSSIFANARNEDDAVIGWSYAEPSLVSVKRGPGTDLSLRYRWSIYRPLPPDGNYKIFVHFVNDRDAANSNSPVSFQDDHQSPLLSSAWRVGAQLNDGPVIIKASSSLRDGTYSVRMGVYNAATGDRLLLAGENDGSRRYIVGQLAVSDGATKVSFTVRSPRQYDARLNSSGKVVDFGAVQTDGMISLVQKDGRWVLRPFPRYRDVTVLLNSLDFPIPHGVTPSTQGASPLTPVVKGKYWQCPMTHASSYSWPVPPSHSSAATLLQQHLE
jgi:hypothetical protein